MLQSIEYVPRSVEPTHQRTEHASRKKRLAVLATHPIQYFAPWLRALAARPELELQGWFCHQGRAEEQGAAGFGVDCDWDTPLLDGYSDKSLRNVARQPSIHNFNGLDTPEVKDLIRAGQFDAVLVN